MRIYAMGICQNASQDRSHVPIMLSSAWDLDVNRFMKPQAIKIAWVITREVIKATKPGARLEVEDENDDKRLIHTYGRAEGICGFVLSDKEYPPLVAQDALSKICDEFLAKYPRSTFLEAAADSLAYPELEEYIKTYQNPDEVNSIAKIQRELGETTTVLRKTINSVLERGEKIDNLVAKSDELSSTSKAFYTQAKKQNSCCVVM